MYSLKTLITYMRSAYEKVNIACNAMRQGWFMDIWGADFFRGSTEVESFVL